MAPTSSTPLLGEVDEGTLPTYFAAMMVAADVAHNWQWLLTVGILNVVGGILCLVFPVVATLAAESILAAIFTLIGIMNLTGLCFGEKNLRAYYGSLGLLQVGAGILMMMNPFGTLFAITLFIAIVVLMDGIYHCVVCFSNRSLRGWGFTLASGLASVLVGVLVLIGLPESSLFAIGILLGVNMITVGNVRIHVALEGRALAEG